MLTRGQDISVDIYIKTFASLLIAVILTTIIPVVIFIKCLLHPRYHVRQFIFIISYKRERVGDVAWLVERLPTMHKASLQHCMVRTLGA